MRRRAGLLVAVLIAATVASELVRSTPEHVEVATARMSTPARDLGTAHTPPLTTRAAVRSARRWARRRHGDVAFAVLDERRRLRGHALHLQLPAASTTKAMLLVAALRRPGSPDAATRAALRAMVTASDNDAADLVYGGVGPQGLAGVARAAGMRRFATGYWAQAGITAADQARFFLRLDRVVPARHRRLARALLASIVPWQRWGIPAVARRAGLAVAFKGGWREDVVHQAALVEGRGRRLAVAVLTRGSPSFGYAVATVEGVARRVLTPPRRRR